MTWDHIILLFLVSSLAFPAFLLDAPAAAPVGAPGSHLLTVSRESGVLRPVQSAAARKKAWDTKT
jgi:hypothetical protein